MTKPQECPKCHDKIDFLLYVHSTTIKQKYKVGEEHLKTKGYSDISGFWNTPFVREEWMCPMCGEKLFDDENDALDFLWGKGLQEQDFKRFK